MQMITIQDVARRSGVSATTVSHVINKTRYVRPELADRVMRAVGELGYTPLRVSHRQKLCGMRVAGIFLSSIRGSYASDLADCLAAELLDKRVRIVAIVTEQRLAWKDFLEYVRLYHLDTAIVHYSVEIRDDGGAPPPVQTIFITHLPTERENCYYIHFDYPHAVGLALRHLLNRGHADIAFLACQSSSFINQSVLSAAHETCRQYGLAFDDGHFWTIDDTYSRDELVRQLGACFQAHPGITAVITAETGATMHIMDYIRLNDLQFPQDLSLITIGDMYIAKVFFPNITRVDMKVRELVAGIRELILGGNERRHRLISADFILGESTRTLARGPSGAQAGRAELLELTDAEIEEVQHRGYSVCISINDERSLSSRLLAQGMRDGFAALGIGVLGTVNAQQDAQLQKIQLDSLAAMHPDAIVCLPVLEGRELDRYRKLCRSGIRLVFAGDVPASMPPFSYDTCVAANESENGRAAGKLLAAEVLRRGGSCIGFLYGSAQSFCTRQRDLSATGIIAEEFPQLETVARRDFYSPCGNAPLIRGLLEAHPEIDGLYASDERLAADAAAALRELSRPDIAVVAAGLDYGVAKLLAAEKNITAVSCPRSYETGRAAALACACSLLGKQPLPHIVTVPAVVTAKNLEKSWLELVKRRLPREISELLAR